MQVHGLVQLAPPLSQRARLAMLGYMLPLPPRHAQTVMQGHGQTLLVPLQPSSVHLVTMDLFLVLQVLQITQFVRLAMLDCMPPQDPVHVRTATQVLGQAL